MSLYQEILKFGDYALAGYINQTGILKIKVTKEFGESTVAKILELVENAAEQKSKSENFITKFAKIYTPIVVLLALVLAIVPTVFLKKNIMIWVYRALSFLVVSCPCALVISVPLTFFGGLGGASKNGILVKGSNYLETLSKTKIAVFDKTGTITKGSFKVQMVSPKNISEQELLEISAHVENYSNHPIALSIKEAYGKKIDENKIENIEEISGKGIKGIISGKTVLAGNEKLMLENNINIEKCEEIGTIVYIAINGNYSGYILISDEIKENFLKLKELKKIGIEKLVMLTGDKKEVAENVSSKIEFDECISELLPDEKVKKVEDLIKKNSKGEKLIFTGDGINDAPVLAIADVGIAMGTVGSDAAIEAADVVIMNDDISSIEKILKISKKTMKIVKENIIFAITIKVLVLILSAIGMATMWEAVFADVGVSILAVLNSLRMLRK